MKPYAITGLGPVSSIGIGREAWWDGIGNQTAPPDVFRESSTVLMPDKIPSPIAAEVWGFDATHYLGKKGLRSFDRLTKFMIVSAKLALEDAGLKRDGEHTVLPAERVGICSATAYGSLDAINELVKVAELEDPRFLNPSRFPNTVINSAAGYVSIWEDLQAPNVTVVDGNCGALDAIAMSETHLEYGRADAFLVGGGEVLSEPLYLAFRKLGALAEHDRTCCPGLPGSEGMRLGEGAAYLCLESAEHAVGRGARIYGLLAGYGNAFEPPKSEAVIVHASVLAVERAIDVALKDASLGPADVDLVCASLSGLPSFDTAELEGITAALGDVPIAAPKTLYGETFGAGGAFAMAATVGWLGGATVGPLVRGELSGELQYVLVLAVGFYGNVSAVLISAAGTGS